MKKYLLLLAVVALFPCGCNDDKNESEAPEKSMQSVLVGNYWTETTYFVRTVDGREEVSEYPIARMKYVSDWNSKSINNNLGTFYVTPEGKLDKFIVAGVWEDSYAKHNAYDVGFTTDTDVIRMTSGNKDFFEKGWFAGATLRQRSVTDDRIELDADINEYTKRE